jgi:hypothetical protein
VHACAIRGALGASAASCSPGLSASRRSKVSCASNCAKIVGLTKLDQRFSWPLFFFFGCWRGWPLREPSSADPTPIAQKSCTPQPWSGTLCFFLKKIGRREKKEEEKDMEVLSYSSLCLVKTLGLCWEEMEVC